VPEENRGIAFTSSSRFRSPPSPLVLLCQPFDRALGSKYCGHRNLCGRRYLLHFSAKNLTLIVNVNLLNGPPSVDRVENDLDGGTAVNRSRAADDFKSIRKRMKELRRETGQTPAADTELRSDQSGRRGDRDRPEELVLRRLKERTSYLR
jgi:hypothetical protein